jgi:AraC family transcriptional regulator of adaptative response/methylated-DNA-[protein]-cysteine methyltransferase
MRAVGNACSTNNLSIAVPCHRVLHSDGSLGYLWEIDRQRALLSREDAAVSRKRPTSAAHDN